MNKPLLSVCLITYNQAQYIKEAIDSILVQEVDFAWELIIADDCSTDGTREIILEYKKKHPNFIKLILQKNNVGPEKNWHELMAYPKSKYVAYIEGDDYWTDPHKLQLQTDFLEKNPSYALCFHPVKVLFENGEERQEIWPKLNEKLEFKVDELLKENFIPSNAVVSRRQNYNNLPLNVMPGDWYLHLYNAQFGKIGFINRVMSAYRRHSGGLWWDNYKNPDKLWLQYGVQHTALFVEALKLYGNDNKLKKIIYKSLSETLGNLITVDDKYHKGLFKKALKEFPDLDLAEIFVVNYQELQEKDEYIKQKNREIETLNTEMLDLRSQVFHLRDELHTLKNARLLGKIIKLRELIGASRQYLAPRNVVHKIRVVVAPFVPGPTRRFIKGTYRELRSRNQNYRAKLTATKTTANELWHKSSPLISVVIPYYNRADTVDDTLDSLKAQTFQDFEIVIVDDGSTDPESVNKLKDLGKSSLKVKIIHQENQGVAVARNNGISNSKGKYIICLDSDDMLEPTFIEKSAFVLESSPDVSIVTSYMGIFGVISEPYQHVPYDPLDLYKNNMVITAAAFRKESWEVSGGYKSGIGYEDWEYWMNLSEHGFWGKLIPEELFKYRTSMQSRYVEDKDVHWNNVKIIRTLHPKYRKNVNRLLAKRLGNKNVVEASTAFINMNGKDKFLQGSSGRPNILITIPWMTFGGAETLIYNYCREVKNDFNITFVTGLKSDHEWEYKFKEITPYIYHLTNLFEDEALYIEFISNYIKTRNIYILHIIHNGFTFKMLQEIRRRFPDLKIVVTMFNDRVEYFEQSIGAEEYIDAFTTDNEAVAKHYTQRLRPGKNVTVIPNGINCYEEFSPDLFDRVAEREKLGIKEGDLAVFFVGRLSVEKNPDVFVEAAKQMLLKEGAKNMKFFVIGDGPMRPDIEKAIKGIGGNAVTYLGYQSEIARYLSAADIFVLPSSIEGFPLSILEAMAMKVAVVASDVGAVSEVLGDGKSGYIVKPGSVTEIRKVIEDLNDNRDELTKIKNAARKKVENTYSNKLLGDNYKKLYRSLK